MAPRRLPVLFILITVTIDAMGIGLILPVMPDLIRAVRGASLADAALWGGMLSAVYAVMQFGFSPLIGNLSDRFGRRPVLLVSMAVLALDYVVMAVAGTMWLLFAGRVVAGIAAATHATALAYMADITDSSKRSQNFGLSWRRLALQRQISRLDGLSCPKACRPSGAAPLTGGAPIRRAR
jgi:MFS transporter, DHA1 family, tetracycline resistance protein